MISYPRKCEYCDYISNNPAMFHYHKKTHNTIPVGRVCDHGCGTIAKYIGTGGKYTCQQNAHQCIEYKRKQSSRIKDHWQQPTASERKEKTRKDFIDRLHNKETVEKMKETKRKKYNTLMPETIKEYRHYARYIRKKAQQWAKEQGYEIGKRTYHVDHKLSIKDAWIARLSIEVVNHPANLQILEAKLNERKGSKSSLTLTELLELININ